MQIKRSLKTTDGAMVRRRQARVTVEFQGRELNATEELFAYLKKTVLDYGNPSNSIVIIDL